MAVPVRAVRNTAAGALGLASRGMELGAFATRLLARRLSGDGAQPRPAPAPAPEARRDDEGPGPLRVAEARLAPPDRRRSRRTEVGAVQAPPTEPVPLVDPHARTFETHTAELAARSAGDVIDAVARLSTDELRALYEYESANKKRKTVLREIESQLTPIA